MPHTPIANLVALCAMSIIACPHAIAQQQDNPPFVIEGAYVGDVLANVSGGVDTGIVQMGKADLVASGHFGDPDGAAFLVDVQYLHGRSLSPKMVGDAQVVSNIDATPGLRVFEAYLSLPVGDKRHGLVKAGLIDLNADFDVQSVGALFIGSSHGIGPDFSQSGLNGPSIFPTTSMALTWTWQDDAVGMRLGVFDAEAGDADKPKRTVVRFPGDKGLLLAGEADVDIGAASEIQIGAWSYTDRFDALDRFQPDGSPARLSGDAGVYAQVEHQIAALDAGTIDSWVRVGASRDQINPIGLYVGGGVTYGDDDSRVGLAVAHARLGDPAMNAAVTAGAPTDRAETAVELTWSRQLGERLRLQPDIQYVINPGWNPTLANALVVGVRVDMSLF